LTERRDLAERNLFASAGGRSRPFRTPGLAVVPATRPDSAGLLASRNTLDVSDNRNDLNERFVILAAAEGKARYQRADALAAIGQAANRADAARALAIVLGIDRQAADELLDLPLSRFLPSA